MFKMHWDTCINILEKALDREALGICHDFIEVRRERRHLKTLERQLSKFHRLCQKNTTDHSSPEHGEDGGHGRISTKTRNNNIENVTKENRENREDRGRKEHEVKEESNKNWVQNISKTPLTQAQEKLLLHGPNFVTLPSSILLYECYVKTGSMCLEICYCNYYLMWLVLLLLCGHK